MNGDERPPEVVEPLIEVPYKGTVRRYKRRRGANSPPETQTVERRLELTRAAARKLAREQKVRISLRLGIPLEMHEGLVEIGQKIGGVKVPDVALQCIEDGMVRWAKELRIKTSVKEETAGPTLVFDRHPAVATAQSTYGTNELEVREDLRAAAEKNRDAIAQELHVPGRRRAAV